MADIKTRDTSKGTIKTINKAAVATERMKKAYVMTKDKAEHSTNASENSAEEYASDKIEAATDRAAGGRICGRCPVCHNGTFKSPLVTGSFCTDIITVCRMHAVDQVVRRHHRHRLCVADCNLKSFQVNLTQGSF